MAKASLTWWSVFMLFVFYEDTYANVNHTHDLKLLQYYRDFIDNYTKVYSCRNDYYTGSIIIHDYSFWDNETKIANNVANYLTSMWRYKGENNRSLIENEEAIYTLVNTVAITFGRIYGSAVCFDENKFQARRQFCPYAFKKKAVAISE